MELLLVMGVIFFIYVFVKVGPFCIVGAFLLIWGLNQLFGLNIPFNFTTWIGALVVLALCSGMSK